MARFTINGIDFDPLDDSSSNARREVALRSNYILVQPSGPL